MLIKSEFPQTLKNENVTPVHKKGSRNGKTNYRPVSILSNPSKVYEKCIFSMMLYENTDVVLEKTLVHNIIY